MWLLLAVDVVALLAHGVGFSPLVDGWMNASVEILPAFVCWAAVSRAGHRRREVILLAVGVTSFAAGNAIFDYAAASHANPPFPSAADLGFLAFYPLVIAALAMSVRREFRGVQAAVLWDSAIGALGAACAMAVVLDPVFRGASGGALAKTVSLAYPFFDTLLISAVVGVAALFGWRRRSAWLWWIAGLSLFAAADVIYALRQAHDAYVVGTAVDALWPAGLALLALWARSPMKYRPIDANRTALGVPALATLVSVAVLVAASRTHLPMTAVGLAAVTIAAATGRIQLAFRQFRRLAVLRRQATTDDLTGLANRRALYTHVTSQLLEPAASRALLLLDLNRFKEVNDSLGHHVGDQLLVHVAQRIGAVITGAGLLARLGGDEFAVLLTDADETQAAAMANDVQAALSAPIVLNGIALHTSVSIGIALAPEHGNEVSLLLRRADIAMYKAKNSSEGYRVYSARDDHLGQERLRMLQELGAALTEDQFFLHYQPKVRLPDGRIDGVEALVRWRHPTRGVLYPGSFLSLMQDSGMMHSLTQRVLVLALDQAAAWRDQGRRLTVAVNLSPSSLLDAELPGVIAAMLATRRLSAGALQVEITEEVLMSDRDQARTILSRLRGYGVQIAVDDFGTGYSSLSYLRDLPIDELKLDRSFIFPMAADSRAAALVASTVSLAHSLGLRMVAEGVEDEATYTELARYGCDEIQGFYVSRPVPAVELEQWLDRREGPLASGVVAPREPVFAEAARAVGQAA